jgi:hypothetical protein
MLTMETQMRKLLTMEMPAKLTPTMGVPTTERLTEGLTGWGSATVMLMMETLMMELLTGLGGDGDFGGSVNEDGVDDEGGVEGENN